jgi:hypothetical protein
MLSHIWVRAGTTGPETDDAQWCAASRGSASHLPKIPYFIAASVEQQFITAKVYRV